MQHEQITRDRRVVTQNQVDSMTSVILDEVLPERILARPAYV
jgi:hypothetical protein